MSVEIVLHEAAAWYVWCDSEVSAPVHGPGPRILQFWEGKRPWDKGDPRRGQQGRRVEVAGLGLRAEESSPVHMHSLVPQIRTQAPVGPGWGRQARLRWTSQTDRQGEGRTQPRLRAARGLALSQQVEVEMQSSSGRSEGEGSSWSLGDSWVDGQK